MSKRTIVITGVVLGATVAVGLGFYLTRGGAAGNPHAGANVEAAPGKADAPGATERAQIYERLGDRIFTQTVQPSAKQPDQFAVFAGRVTRPTGTQYFVHMPFEHHVQIGPEDAVGLVRFSYKMQGKKLEAAGVAASFVDWSCTPLGGYRFSLYKQMFVVYDLKKEKFMGQLQYGNGEWTGMFDIDPSFFSALAAALKDLESFRAIKLPIEL